MGRLFESPWAITIIIIVVLLLFAAPKLPGMARSLGQSMRILKSEVKEMKSDGKDDAASPHPTPSAPPAHPAPAHPAPAHPAATYPAPVPPVQPVPTTQATPEAPYEGRIVNNPTQGNVPGDGTGTGAQL